MNRVLLLDYLYTILSKKEAKQNLKYGSVYVNDKVITKFDYSIGPKDIVKIKKTPLDIIYEDKDILVISKDAGLLSVSTPKDNNTLFKLASDYVKEKNSKNKIFIVHRLDRDTSGIILLAKSEKVKNLYQNDWNELVIKRGYIAKVDGITELSGTIKSYLKEHNCFVYSTKDPENKLAITHYTRIRTINEQSLLEISIDSGRKNQIRVHMKDIGHPIVGDLKYGNVKGKRLYLHAYLLVVKNPITKEEMTFQKKAPF